MPQRPKIVTEDSGTPSPLALPHFECVRGAVLIFFVCGCRLAVCQHLHQVLIRPGHGHRIAHGDGYGVTRAALVRAFQPFDDQ